MQNEMEKATRCAEVFALPYGPHGRVEDVLS
jgi:hypothetical protein